LEGSPAGSTPVRSTDGTRIEGNVNTMAEPKRHPDERDLADQDPVEVLRRLLAISPKDAEKVREDAAKAMESGREGNDS
jgi:hypothetical protein